MGIIHIFVTLFYSYQSKLFCRHIDFKAMLPLQCMPNFMWVLQAVCRKVCVCVCVCVSRHSVVSDSLRPYGLEPTSLLCPWNSPGKNTRVGCYFLLQVNLPDPIIEPTSLEGMDFYHVGNKMCFQIYFGIFSVD